MTYEESFWRTGKAEGAKSALAGRFHWVEVSSECAITRVEVAESLRF